MLSPISHVKFSSSIPVKPQAAREFKPQAEPAVLFGADKPASRKLFTLPAMAAAIAAVLQGFTPAPAAAQAFKDVPVAACDNDGRQVAITPIDPNNLNSQTITDAVSTHTANLADYARPAVVKIETVSPAATEPAKKQGGKGSGFVCRADGLILTNWHVVEGAVTSNGDITVHFADGRQYKGTFVGADPKMDIAVVRIKPEGPLPTLQFADSDQIRIGEYVAAFGNPLVFDWTFTSGTVTGKRRQSMEELGNLKTEIMQTDTQVLPGNSGGPFLNRHGKVDGLATALYGAPTNSLGNTSNNLARALWRIEHNKTMDRLTLGLEHPPISAREFFDRFAEDMGKDAEGKVDPALRATLLQTQNALKKAPASVNGLLVTKMHDGNAAKMGMQVGDIIVSVNGENLGSKVSEHTINWHYTDENVSFGIFRNGETITMQYQGSK